VPETLDALDRWVRADQWPQIECPVCQVGVLSAEFLQQRPTEASMAEYRRRTHDASVIEGHFHGVLTCGFGQCGESVTVAGDFGVDYDATDDGHTKEFEYFRLRFATPALILIKPPPGTPPSVLAAIRSASSVLWTDPNAAANRLRVATEALLTAQKVRRTTINQQGKREALKTHARIVAFQKRQSKAADALLAVKWIGNNGSHDSELSISDVLTGANMLSYALRILYDKADAEIEREVRKVNARKGVRKRPSRPKN
jgi:hypothetical protein